MLLTNEQKIPVLQWPKSCSKGTQDIAKGPLMSSLCLVFLMRSRLFIAAPAGQGLTSWLLLVMFIVFLLLSHVVSSVRCGS